MRGDGPPRGDDGGLWDDGRDTEPATLPAASGLLGPRVHSVGELTRIVRDAIRRSSGLQGLWVEGEVGQVTVSSAGHSYFTLKDDRAQVRCMIFRDDRLAMPARAADGHPTRRPRSRRRLRAAGHVPALRRLGPAGRHRRARAALRGAQGAAGGRGSVRGEPQAAAAAVPADDRHLHVALGRRPPRHPRRHRAALAARAHRRELVPRPGARSRRLDRPRAAADRTLDRPGQRTRGRRRHPRARWRFARGPLGVQRGGGRARGRRASPADRRRRGPRDGHDARGVRRRRPRGHAVGRCRARHAGPGGARPAPRPSGVDAHPERASPPCRGPRLARGRGTRRSTRSRPGAALAAERERAGLLLDRATRLVTGRLDGAGREVETLSRRLDAALETRSRIARVEIDALRRQSRGAQPVRDPRARLRHRPRRRWPRRHPGALPGRRRRPRRPARAGRAGRPGRARARLAHMTEPAVTAARPRRPRRAPPTEIASLPFDRRSRSCATSSSSSRTGACRSRNRSRSTSAASRSTSIAASSSPRPSCGSSAWWTRPADRHATLDLRPDDEDDDGMRSARGAPRPRGPQGHSTTTRRASSAPSCASASSRRSRHGRPPGQLAGRRRADGRAPSGARQPARPDRLGHRAPGLCAQAPDRPAGAVRHAAPARRRRWLPATQRERARRHGRRARRHRASPSPRGSRWPATGAAARSTSRSSSGTRRS